MRLILFYYFNYFTTLIFITARFYWGMWGNKILVWKTYYVKELCKPCKRKREAFVSMRASSIFVSSFILHIFVLVCSFSVSSFARHLTASATKVLARNAGTYQLFGFHGARYHLVARSSLRHGTTFRSSFSRHPWHTDTTWRESGVSRGWIGTRHEYKFIVPLNLWFATMVGTGCLGMP